VNRWRYHYPQCSYPYQDLVSQNTARGRLQPEYELIDTGAFDSGRYWITEVHYAKAGPDDLLMQISVTNAGPGQATLHVLPTGRGQARGRPPLGRGAAQPPASRGKRP